MTTKDDLLTIEKKFWTEGAEFYRQNVDDECLVAFTEMAGVMSNEDVAKSVSNDTPRWRKVDFEPKGLVEPAPGTAMLSYEAKATRADGKPYAALVSSGYVKRDGAWKLTFHQQTPLENVKGKQGQQ